MNPVFIGAVILRREAFVASGGFDPKLCGAADWELWLRMAHRFTWAYLHEPLAIYTRHRENMSSNHEKMIGEFAMSLRNVLAKCDLNADEHRYIRERLASQLYGHAYLAYDRGDYRTARQRFAEHLRMKVFSARSFALWTACALPFGLTGRLRRMKQAFSGERPA